MSSANIGIDLIDQCISSSGGAESNSGVNSIIHNELNLRKERGVYVIPELKVNNLTFSVYMPNCSISTGFLNCPVFSAICLNFSPFKAPKICNSTEEFQQAADPVQLNTNCPFGQIKDACGICGGNGSVDACGFCLPQNHYSRRDNISQCAAGIQTDSESVAYILGISFSTIAVVVSAIPYTKEVLLLFLPQQMYELESQNFARSLPFAVSQLVTWDFLQSTALLGVLNGNQFPGFLKSYIFSFKWTLGIIEIPAIVKSSLTYSNKVFGIQMTNLLYLQILLFLILLSCILFFYILSVISLRISTLFFPKFDPMFRIENIRSKVSNIFINLCILEIYGLILSATFHFLSWENAASLILALLAYVFVLSFTVIGFVIVRYNSEVVLFQQKFLAKLGCFYSDYKFKQRFFFLIEFALRFILTMALPLLFQYFWAQFSIFLTFKFVLFNLRLHQNPFNSEFKRKFLIFLGALEFFQFWFLCFIQGDIKKEHFSVALIFFNIGGILALLFIHLVNILWRKVFKMYGNQRNVCKDMEIKSLPIPLVPEIEDAKLTPPDELKQENCKTQDFDSKMNEHQNIEEFKNVLELISNWDEEDGKSLDIPIQRVI
jgi:hypothetical protein